MICWCDSWTALFRTPAQTTLDQGAAQGLFSESSDRLAADGKSPAAGAFSGCYWYSFRSHIAPQPYCPAAGGLPGRGSDRPTSQWQHDPAGSRTGHCVCAASAFLVPLYVGLVAGGAETVGELTGYFLGCSGRGVVGEGRVSQWLGTWMRRRGWLLLFLLAFLPNPGLWTWPV